MSLTRHLRSRAVIAGHALGARGAAMAVGAKAEPDRAGGPGNLQPHPNGTGGEIILTDGWLRVFPDAELLRLPDAGQYPQEDAHEQIVPALLGFLAARPERVER